MISNQELFDSISSQSSFNTFFFEAMKQFFIGDPDKINDFFNETENPLFALVRLNRKSEISELLNIGADINSRSPKTNMSAVQYAVTTRID